MIILNLCCTNRHRFEGWFASGDEFSRQFAKRGVICPICGDHEVTRLPSSPHFKRSAPAAKQEAAQREEASEKDDLRAVLALMRRILADSEDVGERFPEEARRIHYAEAPARLIRGMATKEETRELQEEGIMVVAFPIPPGRDMH